MSRHIFVPSILIVIASLAWVASAAVGVTAQHQGPAHHHPEAQKLKNPMPATPESISAGRELFQTNCTECHGDGGRGDGPKAEGMDPVPSNLTDDKWTHGSTDGEIYTVIQDGTRTGMRRFGDRLKPEQIWHLVNYVRSLGPARTSPAAQPGR